MTVTRRTPDLTGGSRILGMTAKLKFPSTYTILFGLIVVVALATWFVPAGRYDRQTDVTLGWVVPVAGSYREVAPNPQGFVDIILAPIAGFFDHTSYHVAAIDVALYVLVIGGYLGVVNRTGALDSAIEWTVQRLKGRVKWMIPVLMGLLAAGGTVFGIAEETLAFYPLIIPLMIAARYDAVTGVAIVMLGTGAGTLGSTINAYATIVASDTAGIPFTDGIWLRFVILALCWLVCVVYVMRYAERVRRFPENSIIADLRDSHAKHFLKSHKPLDRLVASTPTRPQKITLVVLALSLAAMFWGVLVEGWWMAEMSALFLFSSILVGLVARMGEEDLVNSFVEGARGLLGAALIIGIARGIVVVMDAGGMVDTVLFWSENAISGLSGASFINATFGFEAALSFFVPSPSNLAVLSIPIIAPLADVAGVQRALVITAFQSANGLANLIVPTSAVVMGGLAVARVPYERWLRFIWPLLVALTVITSLTISGPSFFN